VSREPLVRTVCLAVALICAVAVPTLCEPLWVGAFADPRAHDGNSPLDGFLMVDWAERLSAFGEPMNVWPADVVNQSGDFVNGCFTLGAELGESARIPGLLALAATVYAGFDSPRYHVLGNHDVEDLTKEECLAGVDADRLGEPEIADAPAVRAILEETGDVVAAFQGRDHGGDYAQIGGIHYVTFAAPIGRIGGKPPTWACVTLDPESRTIQIVGEGERQDLHLDD